MNEEAIKILQGFIDHAFEFAKEQESEREKPILTKDLDFRESFYFRLCYDLKNELGLDLKGVIPE